MPNTTSYGELHDRVASRSGAAERLRALRRDTLAEIGPHELPHPLESSEINPTTSGGRDQAS